MKRSGSPQRRRVLFFNKLNSIGAIVLFLGILLMINIIAGKIQWTYDMTADKIFTLSDQTKNVLENLDRPVKIVGFYPEGSPNRIIGALLEQYRVEGKGMISVEYVDAEKNPAAAKRYDLNNEGIANRNIIFISGDKMEKINDFEVVTTDSFGISRSFHGEQLFTGAIIHLTAQSSRKAYFLVGHREINLNEELFQLKRRIEQEVHIVEELNLLKTGSVPKDADVLVIVAPKNDLTSDEQEMFRSYLREGGRAVFLFDILSPGSDLPRFFGLLHEFGLEISNNFVVEEDINSCFANNKIFLVPNYTGHDIVWKLRTDNLYSLLPYAGNIKFVERGDPLIRVEPLLRSTTQSWIRYQVDDHTPVKTDHDLPGPAVLAAALVRDNTDLKYAETRMVVVYNAQFVTDNLFDIQGNGDFFMNAFSWAEGDTESMVIRPKMLGNERLFVRGHTFTKLVIISLAIPLIILGLGFTVWFRRRNS